jgi:hypothetical protein
VIKSDTVRKKFLLILFWVAAIQTAASSSQPMAQPGVDPCLAKTLAERLRKGCIDHDSLVLVIPGFADLTRNGTQACQYTVYLIDPVRQGNVARKILAPIVHPTPDNEECRRFTGIRVRPARYSWPRLTSIANRAGEIITKAGYGSRSLAYVEDARIVIKVHNRRALEKLRALISRDAIVRRAVPVFVMMEGPEEIDPPITPPRDAYLLIFDSLAARHANADTVAFVVTTLPNGITVSDIVERSLRLSSPKDPRCSKWKIWFRGARKWADGRIEISVLEGDRDRLYSLWCTAAGCRMPDAPMYGARDYMTRVC